VVGDRAVSVSYSLRFSHLSKGFSSNKYSSQSSVGSYERDFLFPRLLERLPLDRFNPPFHLVAEGLGHFSWLGVPTFLAFPFSEIFPSK